MTDGSPPGVAAIDDLHRRYADLVSSAALDKLESVYTPDATWTHPSVGVVHGIDGIRTVLEEELERLDFIVMVAHGGPVQLEGEQATARCYLSEWLREHGEVPRHLLGRYNDHLVVTAGGWRYRHRNYSALLRVDLREPVWVPVDDAPGT